MEIHRYEKLWFGLALLLIVGFIGTITYGAVGAGVQMVSDSGGTVEPSFDSINDNEKFAQQNGSRAVPVEGEQDQYEVAVVAQRFIFNPGTSNPIEVPEDSQVTFYVTSPDVIHGFSIVGTNVNTMVIPGQISEVTVEFDELSGGQRTEYGIVCHEFCGAGHENMAGEVHVLSEEEWNNGGDA